MAVQITNFRLSLIWVETLPAILERTVDVNLPYAFLGYVGKYAQAFDKCQASPGVGDHEVPWLHPRGNHFWKYTFAGQHAGDVDGATAWRSLVPLRATVPQRFGLASQEAKTTFEVFYSPTGIALIVNTYYRGAPRSVMEIAELGHLIRYDALFHPVGDPTHLRSVSATAESLIGDLRRQAFGDVAAFAGHNQPWSVATFVQGTGADPNAPLVAGSEEHIALAALAEWKPDYKTAKLDAAALKAAKLQEDTSTPSDFVYAAKSGRAVWLPREFTRVTRTAPRMSCYHRNLTLSSMRTLLLGEFVDWVAKSDQAGKSLKPVLRARALQAAELLEICGAGDRTLTYRTRSIEKLIDAAHWRGSIDYTKRL